MLVNILDTNAYIKILKDRLSLTETYFITDDLAEEFQTAEQEHNNARIRSKNIITIPCKCPEYMKCYKEYINKFYAFSNFSKMRGFGDVSILALLDYARLHPVRLGILLSERVSKEITMALMRCGNGREKLDFGIYLAHSGADKQLAKRIRYSFPDTASILYYADLRKIENEHRQIALDLGESMQL